MKFINLIPVFIAALILGACSSNEFVINGKLVDASEGTIVYLDLLGGEKLEPYDSVEVNSDGYFLIEGKIDMPEFFLLRTSNENFLMTLIEPQESLTIEAKADSLANPGFIDGSPGTSQMLEYNKRLMKAILDLNELTEIYNKNVNNPDLDQVMAELDSRAQIISGDLNLYTKEYIDRNLRSMVSMVALYQQISPGVYVMDPMSDLDYFKKVDSSLFKLYPESKAIISFHEQIKSLIETVEMQGAPTTTITIGDVAPDFSLPDKDGNEIKLSSTRGKVVLLDFWAAWCPPCRQENPNLVAAYEKYNDKGFEIFQVSLDQTREAWLKGIEDDNIGKWIHVSDLKYWDSKVVGIYGFSSIPSNYLLDTDGTILAMDIRGARLEKELEEYFK